MKVVDLSFGMSTEAQEVLALLAQEKFDVPEDSRPMVFTTEPFINGREAGFMLSIGDFMARRSLRVVVVNSRYSDAIRVWTHLSDQPADEPLSVRQICQVADARTGAMQDRAYDTVQEAVHAVAGNLRIYLRVLAVPRGTSKIATDTA